MEAADEGKVDHGARDRVFAAADRDVHQDREEGDVCAAHQTPGCTHSDRGQYGHVS